MNSFKFHLFIALLIAPAFFPVSVQAETSTGWEKYSGNPVLGGQLGTCFDICVLQEGATFKMWFSWRPKKSIGYTESKDGIHWSEPKIVLTPAGGWEGIVNRIGVVFKDGKYHMWYTGQILKGNIGSKIGYATSPDGVNWTRVQSEPVLVSELPWEGVAVMCPHVLWDESEKTFKMWYSAGEQYEPNALGYATSPDGVHWTKHPNNPIFKPDKSVKWEQHKVTAAQVFPYKGMYYMFYIGFENEHLARIGIARSKDGVTGWERLPSNPIIEPDAGTWDASACYKPFAIYDKQADLWRLWYNGRNGGMEQIGLAIHKGEDLGFPEPAAESDSHGAVLKAEDFKHYIDQFNSDDEELTKNVYPNDKAWDFLKTTAPLLDYPDKDLERTWYFRLWTVRKHIKRAADGSFVVTEFLPKVGWSGKENAISCAAGHHFRELRWIKDRRILNDYAVFWLRKGGAVRTYSFWIADSLWQYALATGDVSLAKELLPDLINNYEEWKKMRLDPNGLFWQYDGNDGGECSVGGHGYRAQINTYMYMDALAISRIARLSGQDEIAERYADEASKLRERVNSKMWDKDAQFYKVAPRTRSENAPLQLKDVREQHGFSPWYADNASLPPAEYTVAWSQLTDPQGFFAPFGPTTTEQRHPGFKIEYANHECQWNGPSWPYLTSMTLTALGNLINRDAKAGLETQELQSAFLKTLDCYVRSHNRIREDGKKVPWIDENINPQTGDWIARTRLKDWGWKPGKGGYERGKDYNHSTFCDIVVNSLIGLRPSLENGFELFPLTDKSIPYFCLDNLPYHGRIVTILYDSTGDRYGKGKGLRVYVDGVETFSADALPDKPVWVPLDK
ncbi:MAG: hypothetical protein IJG38_11255 [Thermoguttaceae bacterium]|nr:hypothetical protein [Thermoguttaceae bacterium]